MTISVLPDRRVDTRTLIPESNERMKSGNREADYILGGGFPINSINIVMGHPGSGKTIFAEQLIFDNAGEDRPIASNTTADGKQQNRRVELKLQPITEG